MKALNKINKKIAIFFGEKDQLSHKEESLKSPKIQQEDMLWHEFPYESYDPANELFYNHHSQGFILEAVPMTGANEETIKLLLSLLIDVLPKNYIVQFYLWGSNK